MNQLRAPDLYRFKQNYLTHKQKIKSIMNRSTESIRSLTQSQAKLMTKNKLSHEKAFKFKHIQKQRQLNMANDNFINRIYQIDQRRIKKFTKDINTSRSHIFLAKHNMAVSSARGSTSRIKQLQKDNSFITRKISQVKSTISCRDFNKDYEKHNQRSSSMSKFKIDAKSFKFIPKNQIILEKIDRVKLNLSAASSKLLSSKLSESRMENKKILQNSNIKSKPNNTLMKLSLPTSSAKKLDFRNIKLQKLNVLPSRYNAKINSARQIINPETSRSSNKRFNNF